ncbi:MAG: UDP-2,4-diacetamido-2,4,6-trideoxy-beta-L-altropyranose hydrolase [Lachnospiraceae bacterium]|nr:UDP-2,4-diacetamido-2,4,6-trideoxy-beta-L-altropyranose hydrolase [Lachnospiraceae bacterium]
MKNKVLIRVDGNEVIASGHVMRCLSIARQIKKQNGEAVFVTADEKPRQMIEEAGFECRVLGTDYRTPGTEVEIIRNVLKSENAGVLLVDSYFVTEEYFSGLKDLAKLVYIDDYLNKSFPVSSLVHYSVFEGTERAEELYTGKKLPDLLFGGKYAPLREEFSTNRITIRKDVKKVLITTGGADHLGMSLRLLDKIKSQPYFDMITWQVISGRFNTHLAQLREFAKEYDQVEILVNVQNMAERMRECDVAISASGTTLYELAAVGVPTICFEVADNQKGAENWETQGYMMYAGNAEEDMEACLNRCLGCLETYIHGYEERRIRSERLNTVVDGKGAERIAEYLLKDFG